MPVSADSFESIATRQPRRQRFRESRKYLGSGLIRGIGPKMAERIVKSFCRKNPGYHRKPNRASPGDRRDRQIPRRADTKGMGGAKRNPHADDLPALQRGERSPRSPYFQELRSAVCRYRKGKSLSSGNGHYRSGFPHCRQTRRQPRICSRLPI